MSADHRWPVGWPTPNVGRWTGIAAIGVAVLTAVGFMIRQFAVGPRPGLGDVAAPAAFNERTHRGTLGVILTDTVLMTAIIVFLSGFQQRIVQTRRDLQRIADIAFSAGIASPSLRAAGGRAPSPSAPPRGSPGSSRSASS